MIQSLNDSKKKDYLSEEQILSKKNHYSLDIDERTLKTGDVKGESKVASITEPETYALAAIGADNTLEELLGPRADNQGDKARMYRMIARDGYCTLEKIKEERGTRSTSTTLNTLNTYLLACGIRTDLISDSIKTQYTIDQDLKR